MMAGIKGKPVKTKNFERAGKPHALTEKQRVFVMEYLANGQNATDAARKAQYSNPEVTGSQLRDPSRYPKVCEAIQEALQKRENAAAITAGELLRHIHFIITFDPVEHFMPSDNPKAPGFMLKAEDFKRLPKEVAKLVQGACFKKKERLNPAGEVIGTDTLVYFELVSKTEALKLAAKYQLGERIDVRMVSVNWGELYKLVDESASQPDPIEQAIAAAERGEMHPIRMIGAPQTNGKHK